jgi:hypothetical protein
MNYLAGPLTRVQIPALNKLVGVVEGVPKTASPAADIATTGAPARSGGATTPSVVSSAASNGFTSTRPSVPKGIDEFYMPNNLTLSESAAAARVSLPSGQVQSQIYYRPALIGQVQIRYLDRRYNLDEVVQKTVLVLDPDKRGMIRWDDNNASPVDPKELNSRLDPQALFASLDQPLSDIRVMGSIQKDFSDWVFQTGELRIQTNSALKLFASPNVSEDDFKKQCQTAAESMRKDELEKLSEAQNKKTSTLQDRLDKEERDLARDKSELSQRTMEEVGSGLETVLSLFGGRKRSVSTNLTKRRMTASAKANVDESAQSIETLKKQIAEIVSDFADQAKSVNDKWDKVVEDVTTIPVVPSKSNIFMEVFGVIWLPFYQVKTGGQTIDLPGYKA